MGMGKKHLELKPISNSQNFPSLKPISNSQNFPTLTPSVLSRCRECGVKRVKWDQVRVGSGCTSYKTSHARGQQILINF